MELGIPKMMGHPLKKQTVRLLEGNQSWENDVYFFFISWFAMWFPKLSKWILERWTEASTMHLGARFCAGSVEASSRPFGERFFMFRLCHGFEECLQYSIMGNGDFPRNEDLFIGESSINGGFSPASLRRSLVVMEEFLACLSIVYTYETWWGRINITNYQRDPEGMFHKHRCCCQKAATRVAPRCAWCRTPLPLWRRSPSQHSLTTHSRIEARPIPLVAWLNYEWLDDWMIGWLNHV